MTSNVTINLIVGWNGGSWAGDNPAYYINVNGSRVKSGTANFNTGEASSGSQTIATWTGNVPHNADGTGSMTWAVGYEGIYAGEGRYSTASGTKTLTTIIVDDSNRFLDKAGLTYFWSKLKSYFVAQVSGKGLSTNDFTTAEKTKLSGIESGAEVNVIESIALNGTAQTVTNKAVDLALVTSVNGQTGDVTVQGGGGGGGANNLVTLWTNPNPGSAFNGQTITLADNSENYDVLLFVSSYQGINTRMHTDFVKTGVTNFTITAFKDSTTATSSDTTIVWRNVTIDGASVTINNGMYNAASGGGYNRTDICIPTYIYGAKLRSTAFERAKTLLWTNPSPTSGISSSTVTLSQDVNSFDACIVRFKYSTSAIPYGSQLVYPDAQTVLAMMSGTQQYILGRPITLSGTTATIGVAHQYENKSTPSQQNNYVIPIEIWGIKFGGSNGTPLPTEYVSNLTWTDWANTKTLTWTVHGSGFVYVTASTRASANNDTGTAYVEILLNGNLVAVDLNRLTSASTVRISASTSAMMNVSDGDTIKINLSNTKGGTAEGYRRAMAFGCTLT